MYEMVRQKINAKYGSINKLAKHIGVEACDLYSGFKGTKELYPKYKRLIAEALDEDMEQLFPNETIVDICPYCGRPIRQAKGDDDLLTQ